MRASGIRAPALGPSQAPGASSARPPAPRTRVRRKAPLEGLLVPTRPASSDGTEDHLCPPPPLLNSPPGKIKPRMILLSPPYIPRLSGSVLPKVHVLGREALVGASLGSWCQAEPRENRPVDSVGFGGRGGAHSLPAAQGPSPRQKVPRTVVRGQGGE